MTTSYDWGLVFAVLTHYRGGLSKQALSRQLQVNFGWSEQRSDLAIEVAIERGCVVVRDGLLIAAGLSEDHDKDLESDPAPESEDGPGF